MLEFKPITIGDKNWINEILKKNDFRGSEYCFGTNFIWSKTFKTNIARFKDFYIVKAGSGRDLRYIFPAGTGDYDELFGVLSKHSKSEGANLKFVATPRIITEMLIEKYAEKVKVEPVRDYFDYIYNRTDLTTLKGKKYHSKRNHINRFMENNWIFEPITDENITECLKMNELWCKENLCNEKNAVTKEEKQQQIDKHNEFCVVNYSLEHFFELGFSGGVLRVDGEMQAFTFGEPLNSDTFIVHVEKALTQFQGAYPMINKCFASTIDERFTYINREDDTGAENLRKAKLSYKPAFLEEKFTVEFIDL